MILNYFAMLCSLISVSISMPQLVTFKDGKIGVNFLGFNAEAGLGGFLTGNSAHGGLSASAGTPFGQRAAAGIAGQTGEDDTFGGAYAGASAGQGISAQAGLGGTVGGNRFLAAQSSSGDLTNSVTKIYSKSETLKAEENYANVKGSDSADTVNTDVVQKIKHSKKYPGENAEKKLQIPVNPIEYTKVKESVLTEPSQIQQATKTYQNTITVEGHGNTQNFFDGIFNIPIATLRAVNNFLNQGFSQGSLSVKKTVE